MSTCTIYAWNAKYSGMDVNEAQEARQLREENARLEKLVANLSQDKNALQSVIQKRMKLVTMNSAVEHMEETFAFSERRACSLIGWHPPRCGTKLERSTK